MAGAWQPHVPVATIGRPVASGTVVDRPGVVRVLRKARDGDLVVIAAPAGYGKTTAVLLWENAVTQAGGSAFAWLRIDHLDADPAHLLLHLVNAITRVRDVDPATSAFFTGPGRPPETHLLPALVHLLEECGPVVVVLDDVHELTAPTAVATLAALVDTAPASTTLVLVGRGKHPFDLARRRLERRVVEIGTEDLKLSEAEAAEVFATVDGKADAGTVSTVLDKTEGWTAGVLLVAMALRHGADAEMLTGRHRLVADYLVEEVLNHLDGASTTFLLESAVLERMCAAYLDVVLQRDDCARMLAAIMRSGNLFLIPLDEERIWFRYHRLFGDLLRSRLHDIDPARFRSLATRAAALLQSEGDIDGALRQAVAAGDRAHAAALAGSEAVRLGFDGRAGVLARRLAQLDEQTFVDYPDAAIARAWLGVTTGDAGLIQRSLIIAGRADGGLPLADGTPSVPVAAALVASMVGVGGVLEVVRHADSVREAGNHLVNPWWGAATVMKGAAMSMLGRSDQARLLLESALPVIDDLPGFRAGALAHLALIDLDDGDVSMAAERIAEARAIVDSRDLCDVVPMVVVYAVSALIWARTGDVDEAGVAVETAERLLGRLGNLAARTALLGHVLLAGAAVDLDDVKLLARHLDGADRARMREPHAAGLQRRLQAVREHAARYGDHSSRPALTAAELRLLPHLATHMSLQSIADELVISRETAKSQSASIYRKFDVSSRSAAVSAAKRFGLLND